MIKIIFGLGNPGLEYTKTNHNVGFFVVDEIANTNCLKFSKKFNSYYTAVSDSNILLVKPLSFVNLSGKEVMKFLQFYKIKSSDLIVVYDDIDLSIGRVKIKFSGGSGGHNGIKSIDNIIGNNYWRLRIGVGRPLNKDQDISSYVLSDISEENFLILKHLITLINENLSLLVDKKFDFFLNRIKKYERS